MVKLILKNTSLDHYQQYSLRNCPLDSVQELKNFLKTQGKIKKKPSKFRQFPLTSDAVKMHKQQSCFDLDF